MLKFIVTSTGRSGSVFMARVLTDWGIPCGHESVFNEEKEKIVLDRFYGQEPITFSKCSENHGWMDSPEIKADSSYMAVPYLNYEDINKVPIIHAVRNPLAVVSSFVKDLQYFCDKPNNIYNEKHWEEWIYANCPEINLTKDPLERACCHWFNWNRRIEEAGKNRLYYFHRVEDKFNDDFFKFIGIEKQPVGFLNKKVNTMKKRTEDFKVDDIPNGEIKDNFVNLMKKYGY